MVNRELLDYVKSVKAKGYSDENIKAHLIEHGYSKEAAEEALIEAVSETPKAAENHKPNFLLPLIGTFILIIVLAAYVLLTRGPIAPAAFVQDCPDASLSIYKINNEASLCVFPDQSRVQIILANDGDEAIQKSIIHLTGIRGTQSEELSYLNLLPGKIFPRTILYDSDKYGSLSKITVLRVSGTAYCKAIEIENIKSC
jgi:hypothetical protein